MKTYRLGSSPLVHAPGLIAWAINGAAFQKDRNFMVKLVRDTWGVPDTAARQLVTKQVGFTIDGETVVFSV